MPTDALKSQSDTTILLPIQHFVVLHHKILPKLNISSKNKSYIHQVHANKHTSWLTGNQHDLTLTLSLSLRSCKTNAIILGPGTYLYLELATD